MTNAIKKWWTAGALAALMMVGCGLAMGLARIAEARAEVPIIEPLAATGPHVAAWVAPQQPMLDLAEGPDRVWALASLAAADPAAELGGIVTSPAADPIIVPDPVDNPSGFWDLLLWAKKNSWPLAIAILVAGVAATAGKRWTWLVQEGTRRAAVVGTLSMASAALLDALINGSWAPFAIAVVAGVFWIIDPKKKPKEAEPESIGLGGGKGGPTPPPPPPPFGTGTGKSGGAA
jgi:hypothetical protein